MGPVGQQLYHYMLSNREQVRGSSSSNVISGPESTIGEDNSHQVNPSLTHHTGISWVELVKHAAACSLIRLFSTMSQPCAFVEQDVLHTVRRTSTSIENRAYSLCYLGPESKKGKWGLVLSRTGPLKA